MAFTPSERGNSRKSTTTDGMFGMRCERKLLKAFFYSQLRLVTSCLSKLEESFGTGTFGKGVSGSDVGDVAWCKRILENLTLLIEGDETLQSLYTSSKTRIADLQCKHVMYLGGKIKVKVLNEASEEIDTIETSLTKSIWGQVEEKYAFSKWETLCYVNGFGKLFEYDFHAGSNLSPFYLRQKFDCTAMQKIRETIETFEEDFDSVHLELKMRPEHANAEKGYRVT